ncbi:MAG: hypothetical protein AB3N63_14255 [Puniceicoccaceae bacterium]
MRLFAHARKAVWSCSCFLCHSLNVILILLALGQGGLVLLNTFQQEVPIPDKFARWIVNTVVKDNYTADWSAVHVDLDGGLHLSNFVLTDARTEQIIITARESHVNFSLSHLLTTNLPLVQDIRARDLEVYLPVSHSPSGLNEPVLFIKNLSLYEDDGNLIIESLMIRSGGVSLHLTGSAPIHYLLPQGSGAGGGPQLFPALQRLSRYTEGHTAIAEVDWTLLPSRQHQFLIDAYMPLLQLERGSMQDLHALSEVLLSTNHVTVNRLQLSGGLIPPQDLPNLPIIGKLELPNAIPFHLRFSGDFYEQDRVRIPSWIELGINTRNSGIPIDYVNLTTDLSAEVAPVRWIVSAPLLFASGEAQSLSNQPILTNPGQPLSLDFRAHAYGLSINHFFPDLADHRMLRDTGIRLTRVNGTFLTESRSFEGHLLVDDLFISQTPFSHIHAKVSYADMDMAFTEIHASMAPGQYAEGAYLHNLKTSKFSLNAVGATFPYSLDNLLGRWWIGIFPDIYAPNPIPADVTVWGSWNDLSSIQHMTHAEGDGAFYMGVMVPDLEVRVRSNFNWAVVEKLEARFEDGAFSGTIAIQSGLEPTDAYRAMLLDLVSDARWESVVQASGIEQLEVLAFSNGNPFVSADGVMWRDSGKGHDVPMQAQFDFSLVQDKGTCEVVGLTIEGLTALGQLDGPILNLDSLAGNFAEGVFMGNIQFQNWDNPDTKQDSYNFQLFDAQYGSALYQLASLTEDPEKLRDYLLKSSGDGRLDLDFHLNLRPEETPNDGYGRVSIRQANLGRIHLLGGLSRVLDSMGLGFSSSDLNTLSLNWTLDDKILSVSNGTINGPLLNLSLAGDIDMETKQLSMLADLTLFRGVFSKVFSPVSENMQFDLGGTMDNPNWGMRINPLRWFQNRMGATKPVTQPGGAP